MPELKLSTPEIVDRIEELPTLPTIIYELSELINDPMASTSEVEELMSKDQALTTKVLKLVNSAYYSIPGGVNSLGRAIAFLGFDSVHQIVLSTSIVQALDTPDCSGFSVGEFWKHSFGVGIAAETLAKLIGHQAPSDLFTCGLVHDMGKIALYTLEPSFLTQVNEYAEAHSLTSLEAEKALEIPQHTLLGHALAAHWKLPIHLLASVKFHHTLDPDHRANLTPELHQYVDIVYLGNLFTHALKFGHSGHSRILGAPKDLMNRLSLDPQKDFKATAAAIKNNFDRSSGLLEVLGISS